MLLDVVKIRAFYKELADKINKIKGSLNRPLTLSEKILYSHLYNNKNIVLF